MLILLTMLATSIYLLFLFSIIILFERRGNFKFKGVSSEDLKEYIIKSLTIIYLVILVSLWIYYCV